jgi:short-subunit dehydrogenase
LRAWNSDFLSLIINISSIGGLFGLLVQAFYSASKFAIKGLSEALKTEVEPFGIKVVVEPGDFKTEFTARRIKLTESGSPYCELFTKFISVMEKDETHGEPPSKIAEVVYKILKSPSPKPKYLVGPFGEKLFVLMKKYLPY